MYVVITGASKGIGKALAKKFAANGYNLILCSKGELDLYKTMQELQTAFPAIEIKYSAYHLTRKLLPKMMEAASGHIFNICSVASLQAYSNGGAYSISKFALAGFSKNLRQEMLAHNIKVTAVYPGAVLTNSWGNFDNSKNRIMEANDIADMVFAASQLSIGACVEEIVLRPQQGDL